ncbi:SGNH/GDSL hydrolase family protein [Paenibacillus radicis (ex Xue et al. 2023)]|uniref:GDSL-type esterase/lipase family protein n=1 Tax=Paenibacillus radicis (ex Xue et al. 2023) TaxID=2972489 RepID=A0ABT1YNG4_9BACL|nr:SGNH/GDSL hydrolase family protein [Paenibacillus radicis (ex Xue et al. 2023)]MCR8634720.1 GDSL-type esterase/lipase family protein [Paenibacillus radicis (ex Xue et al. 2023)]
MQTIEINKEWFRGAVSIETNDTGLRPWRLPHDQLSLFASELVEKAGETAGVRLAFLSDSTSVELHVGITDKDILFDIVIEDELVDTKTLLAGEKICLFTNLPGGMKRIEIYFSQKAAVVVKALKVDDGASATPLSNNQPRWVAYGSSITQCSAAESPAQTWPAIVARNKGWDLTCMGFGGQCHLEPMVARVIRDLPADVISMCLGINVMGGNSLNIRTFRSAIIGMVSIIREKHRSTPLFLFSPIYCPHRETDENLVGMTLVTMRKEIREAVNILTSYGDSNLTYVDGLDIFGEAFVDKLPDQLHPNAEGYKIMANHIRGKLNI